MKTWLKTIDNFLLYYAPGRIRRLIYKKYIGHEKFEIRRNVYFDRLDQCRIGRNVFVNHGCSFNVGFSEDDNISIVLEDNVKIGMNTIFICVSHTIGGRDKRAGEIIYGSIIVEQGVWIGGGVIVLPGVTIEEGCVIGAGAVVTKNCKANGLYVGNPAKRMKELN